MIDVEEKFLGKKLFSIAREAKYEGNVAWIKLEKPSSVNIT